MTGTETGASQPATQTKPMMDDDGAPRYQPKNILITGGAGFM